MSDGILVRMPPVLLSALDAASAAESPRPSRPAVLRRIFEDWLGNQAELGARADLAGQKAVAAARAWLEAWDSGRNDPQ
jgi:hypothetical protein